MKVKNNKKLWDHNYAKNKTTSVEFRKKFSPGYNNKIYFIKKLLNKCNGKLLDVGCGEGFIEIPHNIEYTGIDISKVGIKLAKKKGYNAYYMDSRNMTLDNASFDSVMSITELEHVKDYKKTLSEIYRVLKDDGNFILVVPIWMKYFTQRDIDNGHYRRFNPFDLKNELKKLGFRIEKTYYYGFPLTKYIFMNPDLFAERIARSKKSILGILEIIRPIFNFERLFSWLPHYQLGMVLLARKKKK